MSTRSGKRIHGSSHDDAGHAESDVVAKTERNTRRKRLKENGEPLVVTVTKSKKKKNYVTYPTEDDLAADTAANDVTEKPRRRNTLKEQNGIPETECLDSNANKTVRTTRQTRKPETEDPVESSVPEKAKAKKNKNKKSKKSGSNENDNVEVENKPAKKSKKKEKQKKTGVSKTILNSSHVSTDSFHSAAGSPMRDDVDKHESETKTNSTFNQTKDETVLNNTYERNTAKRRSIRNAASNKDTVHHADNKVDEEKTVEQINNTSDKKRTRKSIKNTTVDKDISETIVTNVEEEPFVNNTHENNIKQGSSIQNATFDKNTSGIPNDQTSFNNTLKHNVKNKRKSSTKNSFVISETSDNKMEVDLQSTTSDVKYKSTRRSSNKNATFDKDASISKDMSKDNVQVEKKLNDTFEMPIKTRLEGTPQETHNLNDTYEKTDKTFKTTPLNSTFDKSDAKLNSTFDKNGPKISSDRSSLISSDGTVNVTYDKDNSRISITSDESLCKSKTENIINTTPVLIESSMDESQLSVSRKSLDLETSKEKSNNHSLTSKDTLQAPVTPLKREGTFTKESPEVINISNDKSPARGKSLPSPGCTPFHTSHSSKKSFLNVTRSLEKPTRRSSLVEVLPRQTRVMFCSPVNNPALSLQQKKKVIKSSLKGSNKSFVFDESVSASPLRAAAPRKRSYTQNDAEDTRAKRKRLADDMQQSVDRLSRPRTFSATAKLDSASPAKKPSTPVTSKRETRRTKLPNFAALHQKQFDKMESLSDCQQRKARRAKLLLTPTGAMAVLERSSPKGNIEAAKTKEASTVKKTEIPPKAPKLPTLESLRPGYTRFGFKMNTDFNPFSIPSKNDDKTKEKPEKPNGLTKSTLPPKTPVLPTSEVPPLVRQPTLPSLTGGTTRKETAKQTIMREKSFTSLSSKRNVTRTESRTIIKGVRTNRRFELQMKMRNVD